MQVLQCSHGQKIGMTNRKCFKNAFVDSIFGGQMLKVRDFPPEQDFHAVFPRRSQECFDMLPMPTLVTQVRQVICVATFELS